MQREIPGARLEIIKGAGHLLLDEAPEEIGRLIAEFSNTPGVGR
jgi:pimeloyl-ACP methyl ester carboxylesterase